MKIYFICSPPGPPDNTAYEHQMICIAEGLKHHNVEFCGNINYWKLSPHEDHYLIEAKDSNYEQYDVVVFGSSLFHQNLINLLPGDLFNPNRKYKVVFIDDSDDLITPGFDERIRNVDLVLKSHYSKNHEYPKNFVPWQFGLTDRIISSAKPISYQDRKNEILTNFRVKHPVRDLAEEKVMNVLYKYFTPNKIVDSFDAINDFDEDSLNFWNQTGRRHYPDFYRRLGMSKASTSFGGYFQKSIKYKHDLFSRVLRKADNRLNFLNYDIVYQFDSWRFWESLVAGCCTVHIDLDRYGAVLPVMPINGKHYIGVDFDNLSKLNRLLRNANLLEDIANGGREWVLENYSPKKVAERFLNLL